MGRFCSRYVCRSSQLGHSKATAFAHGLRKPGRKEPIDAARDKARLAWEGLDFGPVGECQDPWYALAFGDREPLGERFEQLAETLLGPALDALAGDEDED